MTLTQVRNSSGRAARQTRVVVNGKFLSAAPTGVHRVAAELLSAVDRRLTAHPDGRAWSLIAPRDAELRLRMTAMAERHAGMTTWQPWEQLELPMLAQGALLLNLCNLGPLAHPSSVTMMHDAQVFSTPDSYSAKFRLWYRTVQPRLGRSALRILTVSRFSKQELIRFGVADADKIRVVPNGADHLESLQADGRALALLGLEGRPFVLGLANVQAHKNVGLLLRAFSQPSLRGIRLVLVGKASAADFATAGFSTPANVIFAGPVSDAELKALYNAALCLAFPSTTEGFGLPPLEAMTMGCPVIAAPCGALPEVCGEAALYASSEDPDAWADAVKSLADDDAFRAKRVEQAREHARLFTWDRSAERLLRVLDELRTPG